MNAVAYTAGVPAMIGAKMILDGYWPSPGVFNLEELRPEPFLSSLSEFGLPWKVQETEFDVSIAQAVKTTTHKENS